MPEDIASIPILALISPLSWIGRQILRGVHEFARSQPHWQVRDAGHVAAIDPAALAEHPPAGIIAERWIDELLAPISGTVPLVGVLNPLARGDVRVLLDHHAAGRMAADHLAARGYHHLAFVQKSTANDPRRQWARDRLAGFSEAVAVAGGTHATYHPNPHSTRLSHGTPWLPFDPDLVAWIDQLDKPVGIFCADDEVARKVADSCLGHGLRVPEDVGILGVNGDPLSCDWARPHLSTIHLPWQRLGYEAAARLAPLLDGMVPSESCVLLHPIGLRASQSTDIAVADDPQLAAALRYIEANACRGIGIDQVCRAISIDRRRLERGVRKALGRSPYREIQRLQCEQAKYLLATSSLSVREIADRVGVAYKNFAEMFRRGVGCPPREYRAEHGVRG
ncbi:MAG: substrate-binding domain-containing protein [Planctomycetota bacterium]|jgi:LacI family transcriptional regulator|nr:substrate-binding domain-containing protein [Planctomycetota bacterium]